MRRFEFTDDKSAKFWEVEQSGLDLNIRWGRIGTAGQSQTKSFADDASASAAMLKLIKEKTGKGYAEQAATPGAVIGTAPVKAAPAEAAVDKATPQDDTAASAPAPTAPTAAAAPAAATAPPVDQVAPWLANGEPILLDDADDITRSRAKATRRNPQPVVMADQQATWDKVRKLIGAQLRPDFDGADPGFRAHFEAAWNCLANPVPGGTPQSDAILLALAGSQHRYGHEIIPELLVDYLVARHGLPYVIDVQLEAMQYRVHHTYSHGNDKKRTVSIVYRASSPMHSMFSEPLHDGQWRLRAHLAAAPQALYDACAARVRDVMGTLDLECQAVLALLFPDLPDMTHGVLDQLNIKGVEPVPAMHWLQLTATDDAALAQARKIKVDSYVTFWGNASMVRTLLLEHRVDAVRWLAPGAAFDETGDVLTRIGTPEALDALARVASSSKPALARFVLAAGRWPVAATVALARHLGGNSKDGGLLMPTLIDLVRNQPALPALLQPWLEPAANALLDRVTARLAGPVDVADAADLPDVLASVPWLQTKKKTIGVLQLAALPCAPIEHWDDGDKDAILTRMTWQSDRYKDAARSPEVMVDLLGFKHDKQTPGRAAALAAGLQAVAAGDASALLAAWRALLVEKKKERWFYYFLNGRAVAQMAPVLGIPFWNAAASEASCTDVDVVAATWGLPALPGLLARISSAPTENLGIALHFGAVELAPIAARAYAKLKSLRGTGREWLRRFPEHAACALIAPALGKRNEARDCAAASLRYLASIGKLALIEEVAGRYDLPEVLTALHAMLDESPLDRYPAKRAALPGFWKPGGWQRPLLQDGKALPDAALDALGTMMMFPTNEEVYAGLHQVKAACTPQSLADFAWDCFSGWLNASAPSKDSWALSNLGLFGQDDTARKLTPFIRAWPGEAAHARAVMGLDVLAAIGSDVALMLLNGIAQKVKFKGLQDKAREKIDQVAEARGLSPEELADRLAPDLGLDAQGSMLLDFGPRAYKVGFDESLKPYVREWQDGTPGARLPDLPKPKKTDDAAMAADAVERFKLLKKDARTIASQQVLRLELAMCARRRWSADVFAQFIAGHPLVRHLVRRLVWGVYAMPLETVGDGEDAREQVASYGGELLDCFRVAEDGDYTTADDDPFTLPEGAQIRIGLPHALELPADQAAGFGQLLADYELLQPFAQLGRDTYALGDAERSADKLLRWKDLVVPTGKILGLANIGWRRGPAQDGGCIWTFDKAVDGGRTLELTLDPGIIVGMIDEYPEQTLVDITLGRAERGGWGQNDTLSAMGTLDPIAASELIRDMERLRS
jgi:predicted DNA-binding WGR domain protein